MSVVRKWFSPVARSAMVGVLLSCGEPAEESFQADALVYVESYCDDVARKFDECDPVPDYIEPFDHEGCPELALTRLEDEACYAELLEFSRCRLERLDCDEFFGLEIETRPGTVCHPQWVWHGECAERHGLGD